MGRPPRPNPSFLARGRARHILAAGLALGTSDQPPYPCGIRREHLHAPHIIRQSSSIISERTKPKLALRHVTHVTRVGSKTAPPWDWSGLGRARLLTRHEGDESSGTLSHPTAAAAASWRRRHSRAAPLPRALHTSATTRRAHATRWSTYGRWRGVRAGSHTLKAAASVGEVPVATFSGGYLPQGGEQVATVVL